MQDEPNDTLNYLNRMFGNIKKNKPMNLEILDTKTGIRKTIETNYSPWWWVYGNGCCDCNRAEEMGCDDEMDAAMRQAHPGLKEWQCLCYGCERFLITDCDNDEYSIQEYNKFYHKELVRKYLF